MIKKLLLLLIVLSLLVLLGGAIVVRKLPDLAVQNIRQTLGRDVTIGSLRVRFPFRLEMDRLLVTENEPFKGEPAFFVERANLSVDAWAFFMSKKMIFSDVELIRPRVIFRKSAGKVYHAFRIRTSGLGNAAQPGSPAAAKTSGVPPLKLENVVIRDGTLQLMDYDADQKGFVITLLRIAAELQNLSLPSDGSQLAFLIEGFLDQGRDAAPGRIKITGDWIRETMDGEANFQLTGILLPYFEPYYRPMTLVRLADGELDMAASLESNRGNLVSNSSWAFRRLAFENTETGTELLGFDADLIRSILTDDAGNLKLDLVFNMDLRDRTTPFREVLLRSLRQSIKATFLSNFDTAVKKTVEDITAEGSDVLKNQNWKEVLKKNKLDDVINQVMNQQ